MHIATAILWPLSALVLFVVGGFLGALIALVKGGELAHEYARGLDRLKSEDAEDDEQNDALNDEADRVDALTIRDLLQAVRPIASNEDVHQLLRLGEITALHKALSAAEDRFADWIEWAEGANATETALDEDDEDEVDELDVDLTQPHERLAAEAAADGV
jgi:hypothetical protein